MSTAHLAPVTYQIFYSSTGVALANGSVYTYQAGTSTPQAAYTDETAATPAANPIVLDSNGGAQFWLKNGLGYKFIVKDSGGNTVRTVDNIYDIEPNSIGDAQITPAGITPTSLNLATLTSAMLPSSLIQTTNITPGNVTGGTGGSLANGTIEASNIDPTIDLTGLNKMIEVVYKSTYDMSGSRFEAVPQYPWSAPVALGTPGTLPTDFVLAAKFSPCGRFLACTINSSPFVSFYERNGATFTKLADPGTLPAGAPNMLDWSPNGDFCVTAGPSSPYINVYQRIGNVFTKIPNPGSLPGTTCGWAAWSPNAQWLLYGQVAKATPGKYRLSPQPYIFQFAVTSANATVGATYTTANGSAFAVLATISADVGVLMSGTGYPSGTTLTKSAGTGDATITFSAAALVGNESLPSFTQTAAAGSVNEPQHAAWSPDGLYYAQIDPIGGGGSPQTVSIYKVNGTAFTLVTTSSAMGANPNSSIAWSQDGGWIAVALQTTPYVAIFQFAGGVLTQLANPSTLPTSAVNGVAWSMNSSFLALALTSSPYVFIYSRSGVTFTKLADPATPPGSQANWVSWSPSAQFLAVALNSTPYLALYQTAGTISTDGVLWARNLTNV